MNTKRLTDEEKKQENINDYVLLTSRDDKSIIYYKTLADKLQGLNATEKAI